MKRDNDSQVDSKLEKIYVDKTIDKNDLKKFTDEQIDQINFFDFESLDFGIDKRDDIVVKKDENKRLKAKKSYFGYLSEVIDASNDNYIYSDDTLRMIFTTNIEHLKEILICYDFDTCYKSFTLRGLFYLKRYMLKLMRSFKFCNHREVYTNLIKTFRSYHIVKGSIKRLNMDKSPTFRMITNNINYLVSRYERIYKGSYNADKVKREVKVDIDSDEGLDILFHNYEYVKNDLPVTRDDRDYAVNPKSSYFDV